MPCAVDLFDYQKSAVEGLLKAKGGILKAACGAGKTYIGIELSRRLGLRFLWLCGKGDLLQQTKGNFEKLYPNIKLGTITEGEVNMGEDGTISTVQTLINVDYRLYQNEFNVVIVDECHCVTSSPTNRQMYAKVLARCKAKYKFGLTATPKRADSLTRLIYANIGLSPRGTFLPAYTINDSETQSLVAKYDTFPLPTPDTFEYLMEDGSINYNALLDYLAKNKDRTMRICERVKQMVNGDERRKVALLSYRVEHCEDLYRCLYSMGVRCGLVTGKSKKLARKDIIENPENWDVIISTTHLFKEGLDIKSLDTVFIALPFKDANAIQQSEGRAERPLEGKNEPLFIFAHDTRIPFCNDVERKMRRIVTRKRK
jgi:superfamily II DNA or RNA helicase